MNKGKKTTKLRHRKEKSTQRDRRDKNKGKGKKSRNSSSHYKSPTQKGREGGTQKINEILY